MSISELRACSRATCIEADANVIRRYREGNGSADRSSVKRGQMKFELSQPGL